MTETRTTADTTTEPRPDTEVGAGRSDGDEMTLPRTRTSSTFVMAAVGLVLTLLMLIFVLQNDTSQDFEFLWFDFTLPTGVAMLLAAVVGGLIVASLALGRVLQARLAARRHRDADRLHR